MLQKFFCIALIIFLIKCRTVFEIFKLCIACMLTISTPQLCRGGSARVYYDGYRQYDSDCSIYDNVYFPLLTNYERFVLCFNFFTLISCILHYVVVLNREKFLSFHFKVNHALTSNALASSLERYPQLFERLHNWNHSLYYSSIWNITMLTLNIFLSAFIVFSSTSFDGDKAVIAFITNIVLILSIFRVSLFNSFVGLSKNRAYSCTIQASLSYNDLDEDWLKKHPLGVKYPIYNNVLGIWENSLKS